MLVRFAIALLGGGIIGMSRGKRQHAAGLRTHLLVCIGAASVMMTSLYQAQNLGVPGDAFRMPAQVVSGVGFLGAGYVQRGQLVQRLYAKVRQKRVGRAIQYRVADRVLL